MDSLVSVLVQKQWPPRASELRSIFDDGRNTGWVRISLKKMRVGLVVVDGAVGVAERRTRVEKIEERNS